MLKKQHVSKWARWRSFKEPCEGLVDRQRASKRRKTSPLLGNEKAVDLRLKRTLRACGFYKWNTGARSHHLRRGSLTPSYLSREGAEGGPPIPPNFSQGKRKPWNLRKYSPPPIIAFARASGGDVDVKRLSLAGAVVYLMALLFALAKLRQEKHHRLGKFQIMQLSR